MFAFDTLEEAVAAFATVHQARIEFYQYLQWQADLQLGAASNRSLELSLEVGIYQDLAVSIDQGGAEAWVNQPLYAFNARIGAPPDEINLKGQDWGLLPLIARHTLGNGLKIVVAPDHTSPAVATAVHYDVGYRSEPEGRTAGDEAGEQRQQQ